MHGVLWRITPRDRASLDLWESVARGLYRAATLPVRHADGRRPALVYVARPSGQGRPRAGYMELVIAAARQWQFPHDYVISLDMACGPGRRPRSEQGRRIPMEVIRQVVVRGRVQGVGYRAWTECTALERGLQGWVRNRRDGSVEALFIGQERVVTAMIAACRQGPPGSRVDRVDHREAPPKTGAAPPRRIVFRAAHRLNVTAWAEQRLERRPQRHVDLRHDAAMPRSASEVTP